MQSVDQTSCPPFASPDASCVLSEIKRRYDVAVSPVAIGGSTFSLLAVRDTNTLIDAIDPATFAVDERFPYWAELWTSSIALATWCLAAGDLAGKRVLELGCGLGLPALCAARAGATVLLTDYEPDALLFARWNLLENLPAETVRHNVGLALVDWRTAKFETPFDVVIGADIAYERRMFAPLLRVLHAALRPEGKAVITEPDRAVGQDFFQQAAASGFHVTFDRDTIERNQRASVVVRAELRREALQ